MSDVSLPPAETPPQSPLRESSMLRAAGLIAAVTVASKLLGALRDWQIMTIYGASLASDAYFAAFQIPSFALVLLGGLGGPFHTATIAVLTRVMKTRSEQDARKLAATFITLTSLVFLGLSGLAFQFAEPLMRWILQGTPHPELVPMAAEQMRIMAPVVWMGGLIGIFYGILNLYNSFFWPSLSPAAQSLVMTLALWSLPYDPTGRILAWSTLGGTVVQLALQLPGCLKRGYWPKPSFENWKGPEMRQIGEILFPALLGTTIGQLMVYVDMFFAAQLPEGGWTAVVMSNRLLQLPIGVLQTALLVPIFPRFARYVAENAPDKLKQDFRLGVGSLWLVSLPLLVLMLFYTEPLVRLVFQHGRFDAGDTRLITLALVFQAFQMIPYFARDTLTRVCYAFHDSKTPLLVGLVAIGIKAGLNWLLIVHYSFGIGGITLSTSLVTLMNMVFLGFLSRRHIKDLAFGPLALTFAKLLAASALMAATLWGLQRALPDLHELLQIALATLVGSAVYLGATRLLKVHEAEYLWNRLVKRG